MHFSSGFDNLKASRPHLKDDILSLLSSHQALDIECDVTQDEIKRGVWEYRANKTPSPDWLTFKFIRKSWYLLEDDVVKVVLELF